MSDDVVCYHKDKCTSYNQKCYSCLNNRGRKDYYEPVPYRPWYPSYPYYPWDPWTRPYYHITTSSSDTLRFESTCNTGAKKTDYYKSVSTQ